MIIVIGGEKGGTGKTTLAIHLAAARTILRKDALLVDTDKQASAYSWVAVRDTNGIEPRVKCVQLFGKTIGKEINDLAKRYNDIIIDTGGRDSVELRAAISVADRFFIPVQPSQFDVWSLAKMDTLIEEVLPYNADLKAFTILNRTSPNPLVTEAREVITILSEYPNLIFSGAIIRDRIAFRKIIAQGITLFDMKPTNEIEKAMSEISHLYELIYDNEEQTSH
jgi:chromosome partitioning protein